MPTMASAGSQTRGSAHLDPLLPVLTPRSVPAIGNQSAGAGINSQNLPGTISREPETHGSGNGHQESDSGNTLTPVNFRQNARKLISEQLRGVLMASRSLIHAEIDSNEAERELQQAQAFYRDNEPYFSCSKAAMDKSCARLRWAEQRAYATSTEIQTLADSQEQSLVAFGRSLESIIHDSSMRNSRATQAFRTIIPTSAVSHATHDQQLRSLSSLPSMHATLQLAPIGQMPNSSTPPNPGNPTSLPVTVVNPSGSSPPTQASPFPREQQERRGTIRNREHEFITKAQLREQLESINIPSLATLQRRDAARVKYLSRWQESVVSDVEQRMNSIRSHICGHQDWVQSELMQIRATYCSKEEHLRSPSVSSDARPVGPITASQTTSQHCPCQACVRQFEVADDTRQVGVHERPSKTAEGNLDKTARAVEQIPAQTSEAVLIPQHSNESQMPIHANNATQDTEESKSSTLPPATGLLRSTTNDDAETMLTIDMSPSPTDPKAGAIPTSTEMFSSILEQLRSLENSMKATPRGEKRASENEHYDIRDTPIIVKRRPTFNPQDWMSPKRVRTQSEVGKASYVTNEAGFDFDPHPVDSDQE